MVSLTFQVCTTQTFVSEDVVQRVNAGKILALLNEFVDPREAILDDKAARNCAASQGMKVLGTIGIIILAKKRKSITRLSFWISSGRRVSGWIRN